MVLEEQDFEVKYVKGENNVTSDALTRMRVSSKELQGMHENIIALLTRAQRKKLETNVTNSSTINNLPTDDWSNHPRLLAVLKIPNRPSIFK